MDNTIFKNCSLAQSVSVGILESSRMLSAPESFRSNDPETAEPSAAQVVRHLAHELRQPLSTLESLAFYLDIVLPEADERCREQLEKIQTLVRQANEIVDDAVYFTQASTPNPTTVALGELISRKVADCNFGGELNINVEENHEECTVWADPIHFGYALAAALSIFRRIVFSGSSIDIHFRKKEDKAELRISSFASSAQVEKLRQLAESSEEQFPVMEGALSFASMYKVVLANDGDLQIHSGPDHHVAFHFLLPAAC